MKKKAWMKWAALGTVALLVLAAGWEALRVAQPERGVFAATDLHGRPWSLEEHLGKRPVLLQFFSTT